MPSATAESVISMDAEKTKRLFVDMKEHPFIAIVVYGEGDIRVFTKGIEPDDIDAINVAIGNALERTQHASE